MTEFVGRITDSARLAGWATAQDWSTEPRRLHVCSVCGPGGVGKTCLVNHTLDAMVLASGHFLVLKIAGGDHPASRDLFAWMERMIASATELRARAPKAFERTRQLLDYQRELARRLTDDLRKRNLDDSTV